MKAYTREAAQLIVQNAYDIASVELNKSAVKSTDFSVVAEKEIAHKEPSLDDDFGDR